MSGLYGGLATGVYREVEASCMSGLESVGDSGVYREEGEVV